MPPLVEHDGQKSGPNPAETISTYLRMAIQIGAPAYNHGDPRGCFEIYACTTRLLLNAMKGVDEIRQPLREALEQASGVSDVDEQAWIMRRAFDRAIQECSLVSKQDENKNIVAGADSFGSTEGQMKMEDTPNE